MDAYYLRLLFFFGGLTVAGLLGWAVWSRRRARRLRRIMDGPFPPRYREILSFGRYRRLPPEYKKRLERKILRFLAEKEIRGVGIEITDEIRVVIAFFACLTVLGLEGECYEGLETILVYPSEVIARSVRQEGGIVSEEEAVLDGQSASDTVVIAWNEARREAYHPHRDNVIVHELAHVLDLEDGAADGTPPLPPSYHRHWVEVFSRRYEALRKKALENRDWGAYRLLGSYAATDEAEFFAVLSERFFQDPCALRTHFPDLYDALREFYRLDPAVLFEGGCNQSR